MKANLLLIDDDQDMLNFLVQKLENEDYNIISTTSPSEALDHISTKNIDVIITDEQMPEMTGTELMARAKVIAPNTIRIVLTGNATLESAVEVINSGDVYRYLMKPVNIIDLALTLRQAIQQRTLVNESQKLISV
jgi:DNA-binding NtrC family response regulator